MPGRIRLSPPEPDEGTLTVRAAPLLAELLDRSKRRVVTTALDTEPSCVGLGKPAAQSRFDVGGITGVARYTRQEDGRAVWCWAGLGADSLLRVVVAQHDGTATSAAVLDNLINRLYFDVLPVTEE